VNGRQYSFWSDQTTVDDLFRDVSAFIVYTRQSMDVCPALDLEKCDAYTSVRLVVYNHFGLVPPGSTTQEVRKPGSRTKAAPRESDETECEPPGVFCV
jgi:hypothetical protein